MTPLRLIGNLEENFYTLGLKDRDIYPKLSKQLEKILGKAVYKLAYQLLRSKIKKKLKEKNNFNQLLKSYAQGLGIDDDVYYFNLIIPEMMSSFNSIITQNISPLFGCSSIFHYGPTGEVRYFRVLDYPFGELYTQHEVCYQFQNDKRQNITYFTFQGMPFPTLSNLTQNSHSFSVHQKQGGQFNIENKSIHQLAFEVTEKENENEILTFLKDSKTMGSWSMILHFSGKSTVHEIETLGEINTYKKYSIPTSGYLHLTNISLSPLGLEAPPLYNADYCELKTIGLKNLLGKNTNLNQENDYDSFQKLSSLNIKATHLQNCFQAITPTSVQVFQYNSHQSSLWMNTGASPRFLRKNVLYSENIFEEKTFTQKTTKTTMSDTHFGLEQVANFIYQLDAKNYPLTFHHLQQAKVYFKKSAYNPILIFYFRLLQFKSMKLKKDREILLGDIMLIDKELLPHSLQDHLLIMKIVLFRQLDLNENENTEEFHHPKIKKLAGKIRNLNKLALRIFPSNVIPRPDVLDVLYLIQ